VLQLKNLDEKWAVISGQWSVKRGTGVNAEIMEGNPTGSGQGDRAIVRKGSKEVMM
jgi:hypothetical protein